MDSFYFWEFLAIQAALIGISIACIYVRRNGYFGVRFTYTLSDDEIWRAVNSRFGILFAPVAAAFTLAGLIFDGALKDWQAAFLIPEIAILWAISVYSYFYAKKLYLKKYPNVSASPIVAIKKSCRKFAKFDLAFFIFYIVVCVALVLWIYNLCLPYWDVKVPTHWNAKGEIDGYMIMSKSFVSDISILYSMGAAGVFIGFLVSIVGGCSLKYFSPFTGGTSFGVAFAFFWAGTQYSIYNAYLNGGKLELMSGTCGVLMVLAIVFFALSIVCTLVWSCAYVNRFNSAAAVKSQ